MEEYSTKNKANLIINELLHFVCYSIAENQCIGWKTSSCRENKVQQLKLQTTLPGWEVGRGCSKIISIM